MKNSFTKNLNHFCGNISVSFFVAYRERYSCYYVLMQLIENWKKARDENFQIGTVLNDISKGFDCISHDLLIAKLYARKQLRFPIHT